MFGKKSLQQYLSGRNITDAHYLSFLKAKQFPQEYELLQVEKEDYMFSHFLDDSGKAGYDLIKTNKALGTEKGDYVAIGLFEGDDVVCINVNNQAVYIWTIQTGDASFKFIGKNFDELLSKIIK